MGIALQGYESCLILTILTCRVLQVEVLIAVVVAHGFVIERCIGHRHLFANGCLEVWHRVYGRIGKCIVQALYGSLCITDIEIAGGEVAPCIGSKTVVSLLQ